MQELKLHIKGHLPRNICFFFSFVHYLLLVLTAKLVIQTSQVTIKAITIRTVTCLGKKDGEKIFGGWVSHLSDLCLWRVFIVARFYALVIIQATSGLHILTNVT